MIIAECDKEEITAVNSKPTYYAFFSAYVFQQKQLAVVVILP